MSLGCGACRHMISGGFGILYRLEKTGKETLRYPDKEKDFVPPNAAVCDDCWRTLPKSEKGEGEAAKAEAEKGKDAVFVYLPAYSSVSSIWGAKTWSGIVTQEDKPVFIKPLAAARHFPQAVRIIEEWVAGEAAKKRKRS